ncbi:DUF5694 domain-containing protein [Rubrivirga sp.]|uniref:DUF5694 domain-containing protein n=1 Tax=Rubrivirga sp. TaxID=1885344 RepID=UPI003C794D4A
MLTSSLLRLLALALPAACAPLVSAQAPNPFDEPTPNPTVWPECAGGQIQVMLLGTAHLANNSPDTYTVDVPDVLVPERQAELDDLVERLAAFAPQHVGVEWVWGEEDARADSLYAAYLASGGLSDDADEAVQVGFRLARRLGLDGVQPIDFPRDPLSTPIREYVARGGEIKHTMDYNQLIPDRLRVDEDSLIRAVSLVDYYTWLNDDSALRGNHFQMFMALGAGQDADYPGPNKLTAWYGRNVNMVHHILRTVRPGDERVFVVVGAGHVRSMRHMLDEAPHFCPVSPLPYLEDV